VTLSLLVTARTGLLRTFQLLSPLSTALLARGLNWEEAGSFGRIAIYAL